MNLIIENLGWEKMQGLIPAVVQHAYSGKVLMLGYMNLEAINQTIHSKNVTFYSRSKQRLWKKGESSNHVLSLINIVSDCDGDSLLISALPQGNTCHFDRESCFNEGYFSLQFISELEVQIKQRQEGTQMSYTKHLLESDIIRIAQKVGEEAVETVLAAIGLQNADFCEEMADLFYHMLVLLRAKKLSFLDIVEVLRTRSRKD